MSHVNLPYVTTSFMWVSEPSLHYNPLQHMHIKIHMIVFYVRGMKKSWIHFNSSFSDSENKAGCRMAFMGTGSMQTSATVTHKQTWK